MVVSDRIVSLKDFMQPTFRPWRKVWIDVVFFDALKFVCVKRNDWRSEKMFNIPDAGHGKLKNSEFIRCEIHYDFDYKCQMLLSFR